VNFEGDLHADQHDIVRTLTAVPWLATASGADLYLPATFFASCGPLFSPEATLERIDSPRLLARSPGARPGAPGPQPALRVRQRQEVRALLRRGRVTARRPGGLRPRARTRSGALYSGPDCEEPAR
jgi:hypothetical protein